MSKRKTRILSNEQMIREAIEDLQADPSAAKHSLLMSQLNSEVRILHLNVAQALSKRMAVSPDFKFFYNCWGRGTGKTAELGDKTKRIVVSLPRGISLFIAPSYRFFLDRIIPSLKDGLEMVGLYKDVHYVIGKKAPKAWNWDEPYKAPDSYQNCIHWYNGHVTHLISQDVADDGKALNADVIIGDESALLDWAKMRDNTTPTLRGSKIMYTEASPYFGKQFHSSSMPMTVKGAWLFDLERQQREAIAMRTGKNVIFSIYANGYLNLANLSADYFETARQTSLSRMHYEAEYLNKRPQGVEDGFYLLLSDKIHGYRPEISDNLRNAYDNSPLANTCHFDSDLHPQYPLIVGMDFGVNINCMVIYQYRTDLPIPELRAVKSMYVLGADRERQSDLLDKFGAYYAPHQNRDVYFYYDATGNVEDGRHLLNRADDAAAQFYHLGWNCYKMTDYRKNSMHVLKRSLWHRILDEQPNRDRRLPLFRINMLNAYDLYISMSSAPTKMKGDEFVKDKTSEQAGKPNQQHATHLSDAADFVPFKMFYEIAVSTA